LFKQKIIDGEQVELPDEWLGSGGAWLVPHPERSVSIRFGGKIEEKWENGSLKIVNYEYDEVKAIPYDLLIPGTVTNAVNTIRLWRARPAYASSAGYNTTQSSYVKNLTDVNSAEIITKQLYPKDDYDEGKLLRLSQQYFLVSASLQSIINDYFAEHGSLAGFEDNIRLETVGDFMGLMIMLIKTKIVSINGEREENGMINADTAEFVINPFITNFFGAKAGKTDFSANTILYYLKNENILSDILKWERINHRYEKCAAEICDTSEKELINISDELKEQKEVVELELQHSSILLDNKF
jgi:hypothetical protein